MIDLDWFEHFSNFKSFHFILKYDDFDLLTCCCSFLVYDFPDAFNFISDFINHNFYVSDFDFIIKDSTLTLLVSIIPV